MDALDKAKNELAEDVQIFLSDGNDKYFYKPSETSFCTKHQKMLVTNLGGACAVQSFQLKKEIVTPKMRREAYNLLADSFYMTNKYFLTSSLRKTLFYGTKNQREPHLKRADRFRIVAFFYCNGIAPEVLRNWLFVTGLLETSDTHRTLKRWREVESLFKNFESGHNLEKYPAFDLRINRLVHCQSGTVYSTISNVSM